MKLFIGATLVRGNFENYVQRFNGLEIRSDASNLPRLARLASWSKLAGPDFVFSVVLPASVSLLSVDVAQSPELARALEIASSVSAKWLVLRTPAAVGPSTRSQERILALAERLQSLGYSLGWEPHGAWDEELCASFAEAAKLCWIRDLSRDDPPLSPQIYTRLLAQGPPLRPSGLARVVERLAGASEAVVIVEGERAAWAARRLRQQFASESASLSPLDDFDSELDEDENEDEDFSDDDVPEEEVS